MQHGVGVVILAEAAGTWRGAGRAATHASAFWQRLKKERGKRKGNFQKPPRKETICREVLFQKKRDRFLKLEGFSVRIENHQKLFLESL